jgi:hypothetical protein
VVCTNSLACCADVKVWVLALKPMPDRLAWRKDWEMEERLFNAVIIDRNVAEAVPQVDQLGHGVCFIALVSGWHFHFQKG